MGRPRRLRCLIARTRPQRSRSTAQGTPDGGRHRHRSASGTSPRRHIAQRDSIGAPGARIEDLGNRKIRNLRGGTSAQISCMSPATQKRGDQSTMANPLDSSSKPQRRKRNTPNLSRSSGKRRRHTKRHSPGATISPSRAVVKLRSDRWWDKLKQLLLQLPATVATATAAGSSAAADAVTATAAARASGAAVVQFQAVDV